MAERRRPRWWRLSAAGAGPAALTLAGMTVFVATVYVTVVLGGGALLGSTDSPNVALSIVATALVAFGFQPVHRRLWPIAVRLAGGPRAAPYDLLTRFLGEVAGGYAIDDVPARMARLLAAATGARLAQVWVLEGGRPVLTASWPISADDGPVPPPTEIPREGQRTLPVSSGNELLGLLVVQQRDDHPLTPVEERLFAGLADQAGLVLHAIRLRSELAVRLAESTARAQQLRASRERVIAAQDDERRRLERDIHDGAQQHLVALAVNLRLAKTLAARSAERAPAVLTQLRTVADDAIETLARLSRGLYPHPLVRDGLAAGLTVAAAASPLPVELTVEPMDRARPDIEAALYFCCVEALQNSAKHSGAAGVKVRVRRTGDAVQLVVSDGGSGFSATAAGTGSGLASIRDRAESVGGMVRVDTGPGRGTVVTVVVPWAPATGPGDD